MQEPPAVIHVNPSAYAEYLKFLEKERRQQAYRWNGLNGFRAVERRKRQRLKREVRVAA